MKTEGYLFMIIAWGLIISLVTFCIGKIMKSGNNKAEK